jgi:hypothetical protein
MQTTPKAIIRGNRRIAQKEKYGRKKQEWGNGDDGNQPVVKFESIAF